MPGSTAKMDPRSDHGETSYKGSGKLTGKKAVIIGGDSGIGRAVAIAYAREGADILIAYLDEHDDANQVKALIEKEGRRAVLVAGDLRHPEHCRSVIKRCRGVTVSISSSTMRTRPRSRTSARSATRNGN
jgi:NAD(P)-dependent dehydrogenase (short-subunit alcohol dehydrogenase family)